jgi:periplasmic divalent cation tolerance protein
MKMIIVYLTCADNTEADKISNVLLDKKLIACAKKFPVNSKFWWKGEKDNANEVLVLLETVEEKFDKIEKEVKELHSYETPMLFSMQVSQTTDFNSFINIRPTDKNTSNEIQNDKIRKTYEETTKYFFKEIYEQ